MPPLPPIHAEGGISTLVMGLFVIEGEKKAQSKKRQTNPSSHIYPSPFVSWSPSSFYPAQLEMKNEIVCLNCSRCSIQPIGPPLLCIYGNQTTLLRDSAQHHAVDCYYNTPEKTRQQSLHSEGRAQSKLDALIRPSCRRSNEKEKKNSIRREDDSMSLCSRLCAREKPT